MVEESGKECAACKEWEGREQYLGVGKLFSVKRDGLIWGLSPVISKTFGNRPTGPQLGDKNSKTLAGITCPPTRSQSGWTYISFVPS